MIEGVSAVGMLGSGSSVGAPTAPAAPAVGASFEQTLGQAIATAVDTLKAGEARNPGRPRRGHADEGRRVVMDAQRSLQSVLAIRDKTVSAYQEIARMAI